MAALLKRREKQEKNNIGLRLNKATADKLDKYSAYLNIPKPEIVETALSHMFNSDADFLQSLGVDSNKKLAKVKRPGQSAAA